MGTHIAVLVNPSAGKGRAARAAEAALRRLRADGAEIREYSGDSAEETRRLAIVALAARPAALVVVGGDGTASGILDLLCESGVATVFVPAGTGNDVARALGVPLDDPVRAASAALTGSPRRIDVGEVRCAGSSRLFLTVAALGFDAKVSARTDRLRWPRGRLRYYLALLVELARLTPMAFRISVDGEPARELPGTLIAVGNTASYGGGMPVCVGAAPDDGMLDVVRVDPLGRLRLLTLFPSLLAGRHLDLDAVSHRQARSVVVSEPGLVVYADGERVAEGECAIAVRPASLLVMVPRS